MTVAAFRSLHETGLHETGLLILPNAWDAASAALSVAAGARAVATTSAGVAWALGWPDGATPPQGEFLDALARIVRASGAVPVSADIEGGFSDDPVAVAGLARRVREVGAVGINLEDGAGSAEALADKIAAVRAGVGADLFVNAHCDLWLRGSGRSRRGWRRPRGGRICTGRRGRTGCSCRG